MKSHAFPFAFVALVVCGGGVTWTECSKSTCGNSKVESGEQCDVGPMNGVDGSGCSADCRFANIQYANIQVSYTKLLNEVPGFNGASCNDLGIGAAHVVLDGPQPVDEVWAGCMQSKQYTNVMPGTYQATITLLDADMQPLTKPVATMMSDVQKGPLTTLSVNFKMADFVKSYVGQLDFDPQWGMTDKRCNDLTPPVTMESVTLKDSTGALVTTPAATMDGLKLDGSLGSCFTASSTSPQRVKPLPWGHYTLILQGKMMGMIAFCQSFEVFVPPGVAPQTYELVVNPFDPSGDGGTCP